jgi:hypothetical protein
MKYKAMGEGTLTNAGKNDYEMAIKTLSDHLNLLADLWKKSQKSITEEERVQFNRLNDLCKDRLAKDDKNKQH